MTVFERARFDLRKVFVRPKLEGSEISVKIAWAEMGFEGRMVTLWALRPEMGAEGYRDLVQGPAARITSVAAMM